MDKKPSPQQMFGLTMALDTCRYHELKTMMYEIKWRLCLLIEEGTCRVEWKKFDDEYKKFNSMPCPSKLD